jgi:hypothetical protein
MKKKNLIKIIQQSIKEILKEQGDPFDPVFEPVEPAEPATQPQCSQLTDYGGPLTYFILDPDGVTGNPACYSTTIDQSFICCSTLNNNTNQLDNNVQIGPGFFGGASPLLSISSGESCYNATGNSFDYSDLQTWLTNINQYPLGLNQVPGYENIDLSADCPGCTYLSATNYNSQATIDDQSCTFEACNAQGFDNYFCNDPATSALCSNNLPNGSLFASLTDTGLCTFTGCYDENQPSGPPGYGLPNTNYVCSTHTYASTLCDATPVGNPATSYTDNDGNSNLVPTITPDLSSCTYPTPVLGCMDINFNGAGNYNPNANVDDASCAITGCVDETTGQLGLPSTNWLCISNPGSTISATYTANVTPDTCISDPILGCMDDDYAEYHVAHDWSATDPNGPFANQGESDIFYCQNLMYEGCTDSISNNFYCLNPAGPACTGGNNDILPTASVVVPNIPNTSPITITLVTDDGTCDYDLDDDNILDVDEVWGCADPNADDAAQLTAHGLTFVANGSTSYPPWNAYDPNANPPISDPGGFGNFLPQNFIDGGCHYTVYGCTDPLSPNYYDPATLNPPRTATNTTFINAVGPNDPTDPCLLPPGCTATNANNYVGSPQDEYTADDGSCLFNGCSNQYADNPTMVTGVDYLGNAILAYTNIIANDDDGSCNFNVCMTQGISNYVCVITPQLCIDPTQGGLPCGNTPCPNGTPDQTNIPGTWTNTGCNNDGCMDSRATNYDVNATFEPQGTCIYEYCKDANAYNFSQHRPDGLQWIPNHDQGGTPAALAKCEYLGCAESSAPQSPSNLPSEEYPTPLTSGFTLYYFHLDNDGCEIDPNISPFKNSIEPTGNLSLSAPDCCPLVGCTDDGFHPSGQQFWQGYNYDTTLGIAVYPGVSATNYDQNVNVAAYASDPQACTYNIGCTDPLAPNFDPIAEIDTDITQCLPYCKRIKAIQCNPDPDPNDWAPGTFGGLVNFENIIEIDCTHINGDTPEIGDEFLSNRGILYVNPLVVGGQGLSCPSYPPANYGTQPPPFMAVGMPGQILTCGMDPSATPSNTPSGGSAYCGGQYAGCTYIFGANVSGQTGLGAPIFDKEGNIIGYEPSEPDPTADTGRWTLYPDGQLQTYNDDPGEQPPQTEQIDAVFRVIEKQDDTGPGLANQDGWSCENPPPTPIDDTGISHGIVPPAPSTKDSPLEENVLKQSKNIRKALRSFFLKNKNK